MHNLTRRHFLSAAFITAVLNAQSTPPPEKRYTLLPASEAHNITRLCSRSSVTAIEGTWQPTEQNIAALEHALPQISTLKGANNLPEHPWRYNRQYVAIVVAGRRLIYVNAFPDNLFVTTRWHNELVNVCDGGPNFWGAIFDPATGVFSNLSFNGVA